MENVGPQEDLMETNEDLNADETFKQEKTKKVRGKLMVRMKVLEKVRGLRLLKM